MATDSFLDFVLEQLASLDGLRCKHMFGGHVPDAEQLSAWARKAANP